MKNQLIAGLCALSLTAGAFAQTGTKTTTAPAKKPNIVQRHPTATGIAVGVATRSALKKSAARKKRSHQRLTFAEKHPTLTGIAAGAATRSAVKKTTPKK